MASKHRKQNNKRQQQKQKGNLKYKLPKAADGYVQLPPDKKKANRRILSRFFVGDRDDVNDNPKGERLG